MPKFPALDKSSSRKEPDRKYDQSHQQQEVDEPAKRGPSV